MFQSPRSLALSLFLFLFLFLFLPSCQAAQQQEPTPTPFTGGAAPTIARPPAEPAPVTIRQLVLNSADYENSYVRVSGSYEPLPALVCGDAPRRSPAAWVLNGEDLFVQAAGFNTILRAVAPTGLSMTVDGQWRRWRGLVGCGKDAIETELWFLDVVEIVSPNPLAYQPQQVSAVNTLPPATPTQSGELPTPALEGTPILGPTTPAPTAALPTSAQGGALPTSTVAGGSTSPAATPTRTATFTLPSTAPAGSTPTTAGTATTGTPGTTATAGTPGTTATAGTPGTPSPATATVPAGTTTPPGTIFDQGFINFDELAKANLSAATADQWTFDASAGEVITLSVIAPTDFNLVLTLRDPSGNALISNQNNSPADQAEVISNFALPVVGTYEIMVSEATGKATPYALTLSASNSWSLILPGNLKYASDVPATLPANADHYWHFLGEANDVITIRITNVTATSDVFFAVYGPNLEDLVTFIDDNENGGSEELLNFQLPMSGYITIYVAENFLVSAGYRITVTKQ